MRGERPRGLDAQAGGDAGHQDALALEVDALQHLVGGGCRAKVLCCDGLIEWRHTDLLDVGSCSDLLLK